MKSLHSFQAVQCPRHDSNQFVSMWRAETEAKGRRDHKGAEAARPFKRPRQLHANRYMSWKHEEGKATVPEELYYPLLEQRNVILKTRRGGQIRGAPCMLVVPLSTMYTNSLARKTRRQWA